MAAGSVSGESRTSTLKAASEEDEGVFLVTFDAHGRCSEFREWWNARELDL
jgi:hypothetical protein